MYIHKKRRGRPRQERCKIDRGTKELQEKEVCF